MMQIFFFQHDGVDANFPLNNPTFTDFMCDQLINLELIDINQG